MLSYTRFRVLGVVGKFEETGPIILICAVLDFLSRMDSINSFAQAVQNILLNTYLKSSFENSEIRNLQSV